MSVIINVVGNSFKEDVTKLMVDYHSVKATKIADITKGICIASFRLLSDINFTEEFIDRPFEEQKLPTVAILRDDAKRILDSMVRGLGNVYRNFFNRVTSGKYAGNTYTTPRQLLDRVDAIITDIMPEYYATVIASKLVSSDVLVINDIKDASRNEELAKKFVNYFILEVQDAGDAALTGWWSDEKRDIVEVPTNFKMDNKSAVAGVLQKTEEAIKSIKGKIKFEIAPVVGQNAALGDPLNNGRFKFEAM